MHRSRTLLSALLLAGALAATLLAQPTTAQANGCPLRFSQGTSGTAADPILITSVADLQVLSGNASCFLSNYVFRQTADLDLTGTAWTPIGAIIAPFTGVYDGDLHTINGLSVTGADHVGLFAAVDEATIQRLTLTAARVTVTGADGGVLAGVANTTTIRDVHVRGSTVDAPGTAVGDGRAGGLVGTAGSVTISSITVDAAVTVAGDVAGGLIGQANGVTIADAAATGRVSGAGASVGGFIGQLCNGDVRRSSAAGAVSGGSGYTGGFVGATGFCVGSATASTSLLSDTQATGAVSGTGLVGGFAGMLTGYSVERSFATGAVTAGNGVGGGFAGIIQDGEITDAYALGAVSTTGTAGGFASGFGQANMIRVYAVGAVRGDAGAGGLLQGYAPLTLPAAAVTASFWDTQTTGQPSSLYGTGQTTTAMRAAGTYASAGWSIASGWSDAAGVTWGICAAVNGGYPYLLRQYTTTTEPCTVVPSAPTDPLATPQNDRLLITWKAPASDGGSALTTYTATAKPGGRSCTVAVPKLQCLITGLENGTPYVVSITAANKRGAGAAAKAARVAPAPPLGVGRVTQDGSTIITQIAVNGPGTLSQVGALDTARQSRRDTRGLRPLCRTSKAPKQAGTVTLRCTIDTSLLAAGPRRVRLTTQFKAKGGGIFTRRQTFVVRGTGTGTAAAPSNVTG